MKHLPLLHGLTALVDDQDFERFSIWGWHLDKDGYVRRQFRQDGKKKIVYLHRQIMGEPPGMDVHHKNENKLDCRRENMEVKTVADHRRVHMPRLIAWGAEHRPKLPPCPVCGGDFPPGRSSNYHTCSSRCARMAMVEAGRQTRARAVANRAILQEAA